MFAMYAVQRRVVAVVAVISRAIVVSIGYALRNATKYLGNIMDIGHVATPWQCNDFVLLAMMRYADLLEDLKHGAVHNVVI